MQAPINVYILFFSRHDTFLQSNAWIFLFSPDSFPPPQSGTRNVDSFRPYFRHLLIATESFFLFPADRKFHTIGGFFFLLFSLSLAVIFYATFWLLWNSLPYSFSPNGFRPCSRYFLAGPVGRLSLCNGSAILFFFWFSSFRSAVLFRECSNGGWGLVPSHMLDYFHFLSSHQLNPTSFEFG